MTSFSRFFHFNITVTNMERAIRFYTRLGFMLVEDVSPAGRDIAPHLGLEISALRAVIMRLGDDPDGPVLDLVEYIAPPTAGEPYERLDNVGIARVAFHVMDFDHAYTDLSSIPVQFFGPAVTYPGPNGQMLKTAMFRDPDGTALQIVGAA